MREVRVLLTCIGGRFSRNTIRLLKESEDPKIKVIGVDANADAANKNFVEPFRKVPFPHDSLNYVNTLRKICKEEKVDIIIPCSDEEADIISFHRDKFEKIKCAVDDIKTIHRIRNKGVLFDYLSGSNVSVPKYKIVHNIEDIKESAEYLGYPRNKFVLKPEVSRGARGVRIIGEDKEEEISLQKLCDLYESGGLKIYTNLAMEYLPGPAYDVDVLAKNAHPLCVVPRRRTWKNRLSPFSEGCIVEDNKELVQFVENIIRVLKLNYVYDFDCGTTDDGRPAIYEINPRLSGAIAASAGAGVNLPVMLVKMLMGMEVPKCAIRFGTHMHPKPNGEMEFTYEERTLCR